MKVLVLGSGAKDHAIAWWFSKSKLIEALYVAPSNPGTKGFAVNLPDLNPPDKDQVLEACKANGIDFVFIGTEAPLLTGVIDHLNKNGISTFGAPSYAVKLEGDRSYSRTFAKKYNIPVPNYKIFKTEEEFEKYLKENEGKTFSIKPNDLSPSRVMIISSEYIDLLAYGKKLLEKGPVVVEDRIDGLHITVSILMDNNGYFVLPICSEYTKREHTDRGHGVVTGGMGAVCPVPLSQNLIDRIMNKVVHPTFKALKAEKIYYKGILTFSLLITPEFEPVLVDYHVRLNDPATQAIVPIIKNDLCELMIAMQNNTLKQVEPKTSGKSSVSVVIASEGYPENTVTGMKLEPVSPQYMNNAIDNGTYVFFGAVTETGGAIVTNGGRAATVVGVDSNIMMANSKVYNMIDGVSFDGSWYRSDIGDKFFDSASNGNMPLR